MSEQRPSMRLKFIAPTVRKILPFRPEGIRYIGLENIEAGTGKLLLDTEQEQVDSSVIAFDEHSVLFGKLRPYLAKVAMPNFRGVASTEIMVLEPKEGIDQRFLAYSLLSDEFIKCVSSMTDGAKMPRANPDDVLNLRLCVPKATEQRDIADYLDEQIIKLDRLMNMRRRQMGLLKEQRASLIQQAVTHGLNHDAPMKDSGLPWLGNLPKTWQLLPLRAVLTERGEYNAPLKTTNFLSVVKDVGVIPYEERESSGNRKSDEMEKYKIIHPGDIVANRMNLIIGSVGRSSYFGCTSIEYYVLRERTPSVDTRFYGYIFQSKGFQRSLVGIGTGILAHRMRIHYEDLKKVLVPVPSLDEQREIVNFIEQENVKFDILQAAYSRQLALLAEYRAALIHECVTGQRRISEDLTPNLL
jgi:type I restriction enzyme S subunit